MRTRAGGRDSVRLAGERVVEVGQQQAQAAGLHEGHREVDLVRARDRVAELR
jgi:hypothetical protein